MWTLAGEDAALTVHGPELTASDTGRCDDAVASMSKSALPNVWSSSARKAIDGGARATTTVRAGSGAALWSSSPGWDAVTVHEPAPVMCTVRPLESHEPLAAIVTGS